MLMPDVNVLVYAHRRDSERHAVSAQWLQQVVASPQPFALSELVLSGFIRVVTNRRIFPQASTTQEALAFVSELVARPNARLVRPGERHFGLFLDLCKTGKLAAGLVADGYHAALAIEHGCRFITHDTDFARFSNLDWGFPGR